MKPYRNLLSPECEYRCLEWQTLAGSFDLATEPDDEIDLYDGSMFPYDSCSFDCIFHTEVMEHIFDVSRFLSECFRVLKKGGIMIFSVPFQHRYHHAPFDYWRFTPACLEALLEQTGFDCNRITNRGTDLTVVCHKILIMAYRSLTSREFSKIFWSLIISPLTACALIIGNLSLRLNIGSNDDCLGYVVIATKRNT